LWVGSAPAHRHNSCGRSSETYAELRLQQGDSTTTAAGEGVHAAQRVRQPVPAGHVLDQFGRFCPGDPGRGDEQRPGGLAATHRYRVGGAAERGLGHADDRYRELLVRVRAEAGPPARVKVDVAVDDQQVDRAGLGQHDAQGGQLAGEELARPVRRDVSQGRDVLGDDVLVPDVAGQDARGPRTTRFGVV